MKLLSVSLLLLAPLLTCCTKTKKLPPDCSYIQLHNEKTTSGVYTIYPTGSKPGVKVRCEKSDGGHWTVSQALNFYRPWDQYKKGFGNPAGEYWLGLENIHQLTRQRRYELLVDMEDFDGRKASARYSSFSVDGECDGYALHVSGFTNGSAGDSLSTHNGQRFSTFDKDQDSGGGNCARLFLGAFWYTACHSTNPNGVYRWGADGTLYAVGVEWSTWKGYDYSLKTISMKIRPVK
ncbi:microfibril-associated glycoprotein 4-like [Acanthochromis polyacanthus]|uniref:microfibril-associated glycoprotein 4-like n=1 Tax=Acanthochromis polyacanthus TaxID=80966 RepID=UPI002233E4F1|nr:microfibril-associated glycoprotein 4-like [Acanthochromis polyacanthus]